MPYFAKVIAIHPDSHSIDVEQMDGRILAGVPVISPSAGYNSGWSSLPALPDNPNHTAWAVIDYCEGEVAFAYGFWYPQIGQSQFTENRFLHRHASDFYTTIDEAGNFALRHPSGARITLAEAGVDGNLEGLDVDGLFKIEKNTGKAPVITLSVGGVTVVIGDSKVTISGGNLEVAEDVKAGNISLKTHAHGNGNNGADTTAPK